LNNKEKKKAWNKAWRDRNPDRIKANGLKRYWPELTVDEALAKYDEMLVAQDNSCYICKESCSTGFRLAVDHDHNSGQIRGLLCKNCNTALGLFRHDIELLKRAISYLENHSLNEETECT
jgi:hypothetical protein